MKKIYWLLLVMALAVSLAACGSKGENPSGEEASSKGISLVNWMKDGTYYFKYTTEMEIEGEKLETKGSMASNGTDFAMTTESSLGGEKQTTRMLKKDGVAYSIMDAQKMIMKMPNAAQMTDYSKIVFVKKGKAEIKGKVRDYEEYKAENVTSRFYHENGNIFALESVVDGNTMLMIVDSVSQNPPADMFELPSGYSEMSF